MSGIIQAITEFWAWLSEKVLGAAQWVVDQLVAVVMVVAEWVLEGVLFFAGLVPWPAWVSGDAVETAVCSLPSGVLYFLEPMALGYGVGVVLAAWALRFLVRRLPVVG